MRRIVEQNEKRLVDYYNSKDIEGFKDRAIYLYEKSQLVREDDEFDTVKIYKRLKNNSFKNIKDIIRQIEWLDVTYSNKGNMFVDIGQELNECGYLMQSVYIEDASVELSDLVKAYSVYCYCRNSVVTLDNKRDKTYRDGIEDFLHINLHLSRCTIIGDEIKHYDSVYINFGCKFKKLVFNNCGSISMKKPNSGCTAVIDSTVINFLSNDGEFIYSDGEYYGEPYFRYLTFSDVTVRRIGDRRTYIETHLFRDCKIAEIEGGFGKVEIQSCSMFKSNDCYIDEFVIKGENMFAIDGEVNLVRGDRYQGYIETVHNEKKL